MFICEKFVYVKNKAMENLAFIQRIYTPTNANDTQFTLHFYESTLLDTFVRLGLGSVHFMFVRSHIHETYRTE